MEKLFYALWAPDGVDSATFGAQLLDSIGARLRERGAVTVLEIGTVQVATLTEKGHRHLRREIAIEGVKRPSRPEA